MCVCVCEDNEYEAGRHVEGVRVCSVRGWSSVFRTACGVYGVRVAYVYECVCIRVYVASAIEEGVTRVSALERGFASGAV